MQRRSSSGHDEQAKPALLSYGTTESLSGAVWSAAKSLVDTFTSPARRSSREDNKENDSQTRTDSSPRFRSNPRRRSISSDPYDQRMMTTPTHRKSPATSSRLMSGGGGRGTPHSGGRGRRNMSQPRGLTSPSGRRRHQPRGQSMDGRPFPNQQHYQSPVISSTSERGGQLNGILQSIDSMGLTPMERRRLATELLRTDTTSPRNTHLGALDETEDIHDTRAMMGGIIGHGGLDMNGEIEVEDGMERVSSPYHRPTVITSRASPARDRNSSPFRSPARYRRGLSMNNRGAFGRRSLSAWSSPFDRSPASGRRRRATAAGVSAAVRSVGRSSVITNNSPNTTIVSSNNRNLNGSSSEFSNLGRKRKRRELLADDEEEENVIDADDTGGMTIMDREMSNAHGKNKRMKQMEAEQLIVIGKVLGKMVQSTIQNEFSQFSTAGQRLSANEDSPMEKRKKLGLLSGLFPGEEAPLLSKLQAKATAAVFASPALNLTKTATFSNSSPMSNDSDGNNNSQTDKDIPSTVTATAVNVSEMEEDVDKSMNSTTGNGSGDDGGTNDSMNEEEEDGDNDKNDDDKEDSPAVSFAMKIMQQRMQARYDELKRRMKRIYTEYNKDKLDGLDLLCLKYHSTLYELYCKVCAKYNLEPNPDWDGDEHSECVKTAEKEISAQAPPTVSDSINPVSSSAAVAASGKDSSNSGGSTGKSAMESAPVVSFGEDAMKSTSSIDWGTSSKIDTTKDTKSGDNNNTGSSSSFFDGGWGDSGSGDVKKTTSPLTMDNNDSTTTTTNTTVKPPVTFGASTEVVTFGSDDSAKSISDKDNKSGTSSDWSDMWGSNTDTTTASKVDSNPKKDTDTSLSWGSEPTKLDDKTTTESTTSAPTNDWTANWGSTSAPDLMSKPTADSTSSTSTSGWNVSDSNNASSSSTSAWSTGGAGWGSSDTNTDINKQVSGNSIGGDSKKDDSGWSGWGSTGTAITQSDTSSGWDTTSTADSWNMNSTSDKSGGSGSTDWGGSTWGSSTGDSNNNDNSNPWGGWNSGGGSTSTTSGWGVTSSSSNNSGLGSSNNNNSGWGASNNNNNNDSNNNNNGGFSFQPPTEELTLSSKRKRRVIKGRKHSFGR